MKKGYRHFGHDISPGDTPLEAGLRFAVSFKKDVDFVGRAALEKQRAQGIGKQLAFFRLESSEPILLHDEPIYRDNVLVGRTTSASYGYAVGSSVAMGYLPMPEGTWADWLSSGHFEIELAGIRHKAIASARAFYDPENARIKL